MDEVDSDESVADHPKASSICAIDKKSVHRICSGQVVLTLATAVKELLENSIDSGATIVEVKLKEYGAEAIEVTDNGGGVHSDNFQGLTLKHHTSKLQDFSDLVGVETFGFRGEALSSLCALSDMMITTRHTDANVGTRLEFDHNGRITKQIPQARQVGTTVVLQNLFATLPVRHKEFQRNVKKEFVKMLQVLHSYCIISTGVRITCTNQTGKGSRSTAISSKGNHSVLENISNVFGPKQTQSVLEFKQKIPGEDTCTEFGIKSDTTGMFRVDGYVSKCDHGQGRSSTDRQFFFINGRPFDSTKLTKVINEVYHQYNRHQYPFAVLRISMQKEGVDVNVTPDKRQVFMEGEKQLLAVIKASLLAMYEPTTSFLQLQPPSALSTSVKPSGESTLTRLTKHHSMEKSDGLSSLMKLKRSFSSAFARDSTASDSKAAPYDKKQRKLDSFISSKSSSEPDTSRSCGGDFERNKTTSDLLEKSEVIVDIDRDTSVSHNLKRNIPNCDKMGDVDKYVKDVNGRGDADGGLVLIQHHTDTQDRDCIDGGFETIQQSSELLNRTSIDDNTRQLNSASGESAIMNKPLRANRGDRVGIGNPTENCSEVLDEATAHADRDVTGAGRMKGSDRDSEVRSEGDQDVGSSFTITQHGTTSSDAVEVGRYETGATVSDAVEVVTDETGAAVSDAVGTVQEETGAEGMEADVVIDCTGDHVDKPEEIARTEQRVVFSMDDLRQKITVRENNESASQMTRRFRAAINPTDNQAAENELQKEITKDMFEQMEILGQFNQGFIITGLDKDLFIVDQHATDEKYNFERLQRDTVIQSQKLICPMNLELTASSEIILMDNLDIFRKNGFEFLIDEAGLPTQRVKLTSTPVSKNWEFGKEDIEEMIFMLTDTQGVMCRPSRVRAMFASRACRKSIMIGTPLNKAEMRKLVCHMGEIEQPWNCPHGRPTMRHLINLDMLPT